MLRLATWQCWPRWKKCFTPAACGSCIRSLGATCKSPGSRRCLARGHPHHCGKPDKRIQTSKQTTYDIKKDCRKDCTARLSMFLGWIPVTQCDTFGMSSILQVSISLSVETFRTFLNSYLFSEIWPYGCCTSQQGLTFCFEIYCGQNLRVWFRRCQKAPCVTNVFFPMGFSMFKHVVLTVSRYL